MFAVKGNREYPINNNTEKAAFIKDGFDIVDENGKLLAAGAGKTVSFEEYEAVVKENAKLKASLEKAKEKSKSGAGTPEVKE